MLAEDMPDWYAEKSRIIHDHLYQVTEHDIVTSDGRSFTMPVLHGPDTVSICPILPDGRIALVRQWRYALNRQTLELPAGHIDPGRTSQQAAEQELAEEAGLSSSSWRLLGSYQVTGMSAQRTYSWLAQVCQPIDRPGDDDAEPVIMSWAELIEVIRQDPSPLLASSAMTLMQAATALGWSLAE
jgi:ADP-ribose pyrophosphatase